MAKSPTKQRYTVKVHTLITEEGDPFTQGQRYWVGDRPRANVPRALLPVYSLKGKFLGDWHRARFAPLTVGTP